MEKVIKSLEGAIVQIKLMDKDIEALRYRSLGHASDIPELRVAIAKTVTDLEQQKDDLTFISDKAHNAVLGANDANQKVNTFEERMSPIEETSGAHGRRLATVEANIEAVEGATVNNTASIVEHATTLAENNLSIAKHNTKLLEHGVKHTEHSTALADHSGALLKIKDDVLVLENKVIDLAEKDVVQDAALAEHTAVIAEVRGLIDALAQDVVNQVVQHRIDMAKIAEQHTSVTERLSVLEKHHEL